MEQLHLWFSTWESVPGLWCKGEFPTPPSGARCWGQSWAGSPGHERDQFFITTSVLVPPGVEGPVGCAAMASPRQLQRCEDLARLLALALDLVHDFPNARSEPSKCPWGDAGAGQSPVTSGCWGLR